MTDTTRALTTTGDSSHIELAVAGWLDAHSKSKKTVEVYNDTLNHYRGEPHRIGHDLDSDVRTNDGRAKEHSATAAG